MIHAVNWSVDMINRNMFVKLIAAITLCFSVSTAFAETHPRINEIRWKSEDQVRSILGEPNQVRGPIGTHAQYELWTYSDFTVAFANNRAFHMFGKKEQSIDLDQGENDGL